MDSVEDADVNLSLRHSVRLATNPTDSTGANNHKKTVKLWKRALRRVQSSDLDPWLDFPTHDLPIRTAVRHRYSAIKKKWVVDNILIRLESVPFDRGAMRECFRMKKLPNAESSTPDWQHASNYVAKRYINPVNRQVYFDDVRLQIEAKLWGEAFNRHNPPKKVDIFQLSVIEVHRSNQAHSGPDDDSCKGEVDLYHIERFMEGEYRKYNSNSGFVDEQVRNTPQAFSHFTFERSGHRLLVVDIQGVGDLYTDPQIHTSDGIGYSDGNLGTKGMAYFFHSHRCNPLCEYLGLTPFDLAPSELATDSSVTKNHEGDAAAHPSADECELSNGDWDPSILENTNSDAVKTPEKPPPWKQRPRRRCVSFNQSSSCNSRFGPTVARSTESVHHSLSFGPRQRTGSSSFFSDALCPSSSDNLLKDRVSSLTALDGDYFNSLCTIKMGPEVPIRGIDEKLLVQFKVPLPIKNPSPSIGTELCPKPLYVADSLSKSRPVRNRVASGDSGYYGRMNFLPPTAPGYGDHQSPLIDPLIDVFSVSSSLTEHSFPTSPSPVPGISRVPFHRTLSTGDEEFILPLSNSHHNNLGDFIPHAPHRIAGMFGLSRRPRNLSESSDLDLEEDHRGTGNLLHQLMHESHRPSCAGHPTNLDQEIGQSVLGQIHHELARLHEAGRFLPTCKGGWSHAGLGGHLLKNGSDDSLNQSECNKHLQHTEQKIDWAAVLFHERHAAQLGCLEAMIVMAHYHLGLPTQLLFDCPIKPVPSDFRSGVDYLWRAAEGGDRRCMILLARYLDVATTLSHPVQHINNSCDFLLLPMLQSLSPDMLPSVSPDSWAEAIGWYQKAVDAACVTSNGAEDEGLDAEGGYDAAEDLLPVYRILERMAEMYSVGGFGLEQDFSRVGDLFAHAGELAVTAMQGRLATKYFDLSEEAYAKIT